MKRLLLVVQVLLFSSVCSAQQFSQSFISKKQNSSVNGSVAANDDWMTNATAQLDKETYHFKKLDKEYAVLNKNQNLVFGLAANKLIINPSENKASWGAAFELIAVGNAKAASHAAIFTKENYLKFITPDYDVEYINNETGLRQNFIVKNKPAGNDALQVNMKVSGSLTASVVEENVLQLTHKPSGKVYIKYDGLKVWDANNKILKASMSLLNNELVIKVDDKNAAYPITIDPLTHAAEWTVSADGLLPGVLNNLQLQVDALVGYSAAGIGDVNGDGFDDVAIGAPAAIDIIAGPATVVGAGAVFIYFGSATGLPVSPSRVLRSNTPVANALFGLSIAGGNVAGDAKSDVIIGAPGESYSTQVATFPAVNATVTAGKVYTFRGEDLTSGTLTPFASVYLDGTGFFSNGVLGLLLSNVNINALFGFSVAVTGDMTNDGLGEIIVGSPGYAGTGLLDVRSGAAFVFYSGNITSNTPVKLNAPSLLDFPLLSDINGLLFGFSVDGAGDYNKDGKQDVIVGAPGGLSISLNNLLGGSAYIFKGKTDNSGVNTTIQAQLTAGGSLLGPVANLFGYNVKGARNAAGGRTGSVLVSAPAGNVLNNVLGGLRLKAGNIHVFTPSSSTGNHTPRQSFTSPRATSLLNILALRPINLSVLFGTAMDNMRDVNCDGIGDIIVGEPLSTGVGLVGVNAVGGAAYVFLGRADSTYSPQPYWALENTVSQGLGVNAASMIGYSVAGAGHTYGNARGVRAIVGAPGKALDFSTGLLALGNTLGTLFDFAAGDNGIGKSYSFGFDCQRLVVYPDMNATLLNITVQGSVRINDVVPAGTTYGSPTASGTNPAGGVLNMNLDGTYNFTSPNAGVYNYMVPSCSPNRGCRDVMLTITVVDNNSQQKPPVINNDVASTIANQPVTLPTLANDLPGTVGYNLVPSSVVVSAAAKHGTVMVDPVTGNITYTPNLNYTGTDTLTYSVNDNVEPIANNRSAMQIIRIEPIGGANTTLAADDYINVLANTVATGNVKTNDTDPEGQPQNVAPQNINLTGKGTFVLLADGSYTFTPVNGFTGPVSVSYTTCDNGSVQACASATLYILVTTMANPDLTPTTRINNGTFIESVGSTRSFVIEVNEIFGNAIDNQLAPVRVRIAKSDNFNYTFDPAAITANVPSAIAVNNPDWDLVQNNASGMIFQLKSGMGISSYASSKIFIRMQVLPGAAVGTENQTVSILNGAGLEVKYNNNSIVRILSIVR